MLRTLCFESQPGPSNVVPDSTRPPKETVLQRQCERRPKTLYVAIYLRVKVAIGRTSCYNSVHARQLATEIAPVK